MRHVKHLVGNITHYKQVDTEQRTKQLFVSKVVKPQMVSVGTQTDNKEIRVSNEEEILREKINRVSGQTEDFNKFASILDQKWPVNIYEVTKADSENFQKMEACQNLEIILGPNSKKKISELDSLCEDFRLSGSLLKM